MINKELDQQPIQSFSQFQRKEEEPIDENLINRYLSFFPQNILAFCNQHFNSINHSQHFSQFGIVYSQATLPSEITLSLIQESINSEIVVLEAKWGKFTLKLKILNSSNKSKFHHLNINNGSYGSIYTINHEQHKYVIKCLPFEQWRESDEAKMMAIKQFILFKIADAIEIGPAIHSILGFDLLIHQNCIEFAMEACDPISFFTQQDISIIWENLNLMHRFQFVHFDIKSQNIMRSRRHRKIVFIDFGLSDLSKAKIGQRLSMTFRGTLDFACPQMVDIFVNNCKGYADVYYNDAYCLNFALKTNRWKENNNFMYQDVQIQTAGELENRKFEILLLQVKSLLFSGQTKRTLIQLKEQIKVSNQFFNEIIDFFKEIVPTEDLQQFQKQFIERYRQNSFDYEQFYDIYRTKYNILTASECNQEKREKNKAKISNLLKDSSHQNCNIQNQSKILSFLCRPINQKIEIEVYHSVYLSYISFVNNKFKLTIQKRIEIIKKMIKNGLFLEIGSSEQYIQNRADDLSLVRSTIQSIFKQTLQNRSADELKKRYSVDLLMQSLEHLFILNTDNNLQIIQDLNKLMSSSILDQEDRLQVIIKAKHHRYWFLYRYRDNQLYHLLTDWCYNQIINLQKVAPSEIGWIFSHLKNNWLRNTYIKINEQQKGFLNKMNNKYLQRQLLIEIKVEELRFQTPQRIPQKTRQIYQLIPFSIKKRFYYFEFIIFHIYLERFSHVDRCQQIVFHMKNNLKCEIIMNSHFIGIILDILYATEPKLFLQSLLSFLLNVDIFTIFSHHQVIKQMISRFRYINWTIQLQTLRSEALQRLKIVVSWLDLKSFFTSKAIDRPHGHCCISCQGFSNLILIKQYYHKLVNHPYNPLEQLQEIREKCDPSLCKNCYLTSQTLYELKYQNYVVQHYRRKATTVPAEIQTKFMNSYNKLSELIKQYRKQKTVEYYTKIQFYQLFQFCKINSQLEEKYHGIFRLYQFLKYRDCLEEYLKDYKQNNCNMLSTTIEIVFNQTSIKQFAYFLARLTTFMTKMQYSSAFYMLFNTFESFFRRQWLKINCSELIRLIQELSSICVNPYNSIYYFILLLNLPLEKRVPVKKKLILMIVELPIKIKEFLEAGYYRLLLIEDKRMKGHPLIAPRKVTKIEYKLVKMWSRIGKRPLPRKQYRKKKSDNIMLNTLRKKAEAIGGPYDLQSNQMRMLQVKIKNVKYKI